MAWHAELKRRRWYCINAFDAVRWYGRKLYDDWYGSLTDEQKQHLEEYHRKKAERERRKSMQSLEMMLGLTSMLADRTGHDWKT